jgi:hypothetical protein
MGFPSIDPEENAYSTVETSVALSAMKMPPQDVGKNDSYFNEVMSGLRHLWPGKSRQNGPMIAV